MKYLIFWGMMGTCIVGTHLHGQTAEQTDYSSKTPNHTLDEANIADNQNDPIKLINEAELQAALTEEYEYESAGMKVLKYFGIPAMAGMSAALACLIAIMND